MITIKVERDEYYPKRWIATLSEWDLGVPFGEGKSIQDAIDDFIDSYERIWFSWHPTHTKINYTWL